ncbi:MAG: VacJ family lipoprotein [Rhodobacteraceae bacterium]|nr:VacJ family lipoprotein [Paracoccaceae bacterium]
MTSTRAGDPLEPVNREVHQFNKAVDQAVFRPFSIGYGSAVPDFIRAKVNNVQYNFQLPGEVVNGVLQGRLDNATHNFFRFLLNSTLGVFGIFDPATSFGLERRDTDFGETLYVWGVGEGAYVEVPFFGPYTARDLSGEVVDLFLNPLSIVGLSPPAAYVPAGTYVLEAADYRYKFKNTVDSVLYDSADSYAQTRVIYLDNRRYTLAKAANPESGEDVADPYGGEVVDPYADAYAGAATPIAQAAAAQRTPAASATIDPYEELYGE